MNYKVSPLLLFIFLGILLGGCLSKENTPGVFLIEYSNEKDLTEKGFVFESTGSRPTKILRNLFGDTLVRFVPYEKIMRKEIWICYNDTFTEKNIATTLKTLSKRNDILLDTSARTITLPGSNNKIYRYDLNYKIKHLYIYKDYKISNL